MRLVKHSPSGSQLLDSRRKSNIIVVPQDVTILRNVFEPTCIERARQEVCEAIGGVPRRDDEVPLIYARQRGIRVSKIYPRFFIKAIIRQLEWLVGFECDQNKCSAREQAPTGDFKLRWHQDQAGMGLEKNQQAVVAWVPLDPIDGNRPSIELGPHTDQPHHHVRDEHRFLVLDNPCIGEGTGRPVKNLNLGDIVLFTPLVLHRTYCTPAMKFTRLSLDLRFYGRVP